MKEYSEWVGSLANSIEDASIVDRFAGDTLNELQTRMCVANMLVPAILNEEDVADWLSAFSVDLNYEKRGHRSVIEAKLSNVIGPNAVKSYTSTDGDENTVEWLKQLKRDIRYNTFRRD